ncbi:MAG: glutaredoxin 3, partial [Alphaproteobacteria bacterium HGW-Alphaproteobacteria-10]
MADVTIYTTLLCPYCFRAKGLLQKKGVSYTEIDVGMDAGKRREM